MLYLTWKVGFPLPFYCVKHIHGQFKTYLKLRNIHFKQIAKTIPNVRQNLAVILLFLFIYTSCFHCAVWCPAAVLCFFSKLVLKVKSVLKLYFEAFEHFTNFLSHFLNKLMLNILSRNREKQLCLCNKAIKSHRKSYCNTKTVTIKLA
jgi:predicted membrane protein